MIEGYNGTERDLAISYISDAHKEAYGFRPRHINFDAMSVEQLWEEFETYQAAAEVEAERRQKIREENDASFEALIDLTISHGAPSRVDAIRWLADAIDTCWSEEFVWKYDISWSYKPEIESALAEKFNIQ